MELRRRISPEVTDTAGRTARKAGHLLGCGSGLAAQTLSERPVLTIEAVETAAFIENREIPVPVLRSLPMGKTGITCTRSPGTNPVGHAIGRQGIVVPGYFSPAWRNTDDLALLIGPEATIAFLSLRNGTHICADRAYQTGRISRNRRWKAKGRSGKAVSLQSNGFHVLWSLPDAVEAY